jgi:hypothetical protein
VDLGSVAAGDMPAAAHVEHAPSPAVHYSDDSSFLGVFLFLITDCI